MPEQNPNESNPLEKVWSEYKNFLKKIVEQSESQTQIKTQEVSA